MEVNTQEIVHTPVMVEEVLQWLVTLPEGLYVDGTIDGGGHTAALLAQLAPEGRVLGLDLDPAILEQARERLAPESARVVLRQGSYAQLPVFLEELQVSTCQGLLLDLGMSSYSLEGSGRGFSFQVDEPLDMRFDPTHGRPLYQVLQHLSLQTLTEILSRYGEERQTRTLAGAIYQQATAGRLNSSGELAQTIREAARGPLVTKTLARVFQALRIYLNDELGALQTVLERLGGMLAPGCRAVIIAYHSLEDRLVKQFFARESRDCICYPHLPQCVCGHTATFRVLTRKPLTPIPEERAQNPRSRSARLRALERL